MAIFFRVWSTSSNSHFITQLIFCEVSSCVILIVRLTQIQQHLVIASSIFFSGCVFSILFPLFIISGNEASPETGAWWVLNNKSMNIKNQFESWHFTFLFFSAFPLQLFSPVIAISNAIFNRSIGSASSRRWLSHYSSSWKLHLTGLTSSHCQIIYLKGRVFEMLVCLKFQSNIHLCFSSLVLLDFILLFLWCLWMWPDD